MESNSPTGEHVLDVVPEQPALAGWKFRLVYMVLDSSNPYCPQFAKAVMRQPDVMDQLTRKFCKQASWHVN